MVLCPPFSSREGECGFRGGIWETQTLFLPLPINLRGWHRVVSFSAFSLARCLPILTAGTVLFICSHAVWHGKALISAGPLGYNSVTEEPLA